jgi:excisionase family DNA binding protein
MNKQIADDVRLILVREASAYLRVSNMTVYRLIKTGELPATRVGKNYRLRYADLYAYLRRHNDGADDTDMTNEEFDQAMAESLPVKIITESPNRNPSAQSDGGDRG